MIWITTGALVFFLPVLVAVISSEETEIISAFILWIFAFAFGAAIGFGLSKADENGKNKAAKAKEFAEKERIENRNSC